METFLTFIRDRSSFSKYDPTVTGGKGNKLDCTRTTTDVDGYKVVRKITGVNVVVFKLHINKLFNNVYL